MSQLKQSFLTKGHFMSKNIVTVPEFSSELISEITSFVKEELAKNERRAIATDTIVRRYACRVPEMKDHVFKKQLSKDLSIGKFDGLTMKIGKGGGIGLDDGVLPAPRKPRRSKVAEASYEASEVEIGSMSYVLPMSADRLKAMFIDIFSIQADDAGEILIGDERFSSVDENVIKYMNGLASHMIRNSLVSISYDDIDAEDERKSA